MIEIFGLIFRARGETGWGDIIAGFFWTFFITVMLNNNHHTPTALYASMDLLAVMILFQVAGRPGWSKDCWPAWQSSDPAIRLTAMKHCLIRGLWFLPMLAYVGWRGGHYAAILPLLVIFPFGFSLCVRWCKSISDFFNFQERQENGYMAPAWWPTGEVLIGLWLGVIQVMLGA